MIACIQCGTLFEPLRTRHFLCSKKCTSARHYRKHAEIYKSQAKTYRAANVEVVRIARAEAWKQNAEKRREKALRKKEQLRDTAACAICGNTFPRADKRQKFCGPLCSWESRHRSTLVTYRKLNRESPLSALSPEAKIAHLAHRMEKTKRYRKIQTKKPWMGMVYRAKNRAALLNLPFDLTEEWAASIWNGHCALSDLPFETGPVEKSVSFRASIDRVDPKKGYVRSNCRFILFGINRLKSDDNSDETVILIARAIVKHTS